MKNFKEGDLVKIKFDFYKGFSRRAWLRVLFVDLDGTFHGEIERKESGSELEIGKVLKLSSNEVLNVLDSNDNKEWCYGDNVTRCGCNGLCRNK